MAPTGTCCRPYKTSGKGLLGRQRKITGTSASMALLCGSMALYGIEILHKATGVLYKFLHSTSDRLKRFTHPHLLPRHKNGDTF